MKNKWISGILCICVLSALTGCGAETLDTVQTGKSLEICRKEAFK